MSVFFSRFCEQMPTHTLVSLVSSSMRKCYYCCSRHVSVNDDRHMMSNVLHTVYVLKDSALAFGMFLSLGACVQHVLCA